MSLADITDNQLGLLRPGAKYTREQRITAVTVWVSKGSLKEAAEAANVPYNMVNSWKQKAPWWPVVARELKLEQREVFSGKMRAIMFDAADLVHDRVKNGDIRVSTITNKNPDGTKTVKEVQTRRPLSARDAMLIYSLAQDKQIVLENQTHEEEDRETVRDMQKKLLGILESRFKEMRGSKLIEGEIIDGEIKDASGLVSSGAGSPGGGRAAQESADELHPDESGSS